MQKKVDKLLFLSILILSIFGLVMIYSASSIWAEYKFQDSFHYFKYQAIFLVAGVIAMIMISKVHYSFYKE